MGVCEGGNFKTKAFYVLYDKIDSRVLLSYCHGQMIKLSYIMEFYCFNTRTLHSHLKHIKSQNCDTHRELTSPFFSWLFLSASSFVFSFSDGQSQSFPPSVSFVHFEPFELRNTRAMYIACARFTGAPWFHMSCDITCLIQPRPSWLSPPVCSLIAVQLYALEIPRQLLRCERSCAPNWTAFAPLGRGRANA